LRVDMDALPVEERTGLPYASKRQGVMHACGHDLHTCMGLGVARLLAALPSLQARVRLLFQPAEEIAQGAIWMRDAGATKGLDALFGIHVVPNLPAGIVGIRRGCLTAAAGELEILVRGEGGHGARPHQSVDAIWMAAKVVTELQQAISRRLDALQPVVVSFGKVEGGRAFNVIADQVRLLGTVRCLDLDQHAMLPGWIEDTVQAICAGCGGSAEVRYRCIAPPVDNDVALTNLLERCAIERLGRDRVVPVEQPSLGAEDFAELLRDVPGMMMRLGVAGPDGCAPLHNGAFALDETALVVGIEVLAATLLAWMKEHGG
jgi:amidohydrolase